MKSMTRFGRNIAALAACMILSAGLFAQHVGERFSLGALVAGGDMDVNDLHYLGRNRQTRLDEFLAVLVRMTDQPTDDPIYFVHFA